MRTAVGLSDIRDATLDSTALRIASTKANLTKLIVVLSDGRQHAIELESGAALHGHWERSHDDRRVEHEHGLRSPPKTGMSLESA
jgi:hypothetical protein